MGRWIPDNFTSKSYKDVPASSIQPTKSKPQEVFSTSYKLDFTSASKDFWVKKFGELQEEYNKGCTVGKYGKYNADVGDFFERLFILIKEGIIAEASKKGYTSEQLHYQLQAVESSLKVLVEAIKSIDTEKKINVDSLSAFLHGFVNGYMENFAEAKEKTK